MPAPTILADLGHDLTLMVMQPVERHFVVYLAFDEQFMCGVGSGSTETDARAEAASVLRAALDGLERGED